MARSHRRYWFKNVTYVILTIARALVLGSSSRTDLPLLPFGSVSNRLLHLAGRPVLIVPKRAAPAPAPTAPDASAAVAD